jgi:undecaprenyl-phosphate 4-deoxy-4-formamido-L-arabinose transferase
LAPHRLDRTELAPGVSVLVPVYESERTLGPLLERLRPALSKVSASEILLVDDGSGDASWAAVERLAREHPQVRGIRLMRNYGQHNALLCGIREARLDVVVTMDDDLQHPPEEIPRLLDALTDDVDVVYGAPDHEAHTLFRRWSSRMTKRALERAMGAETKADAAAFRAFRTSLRDAFDGFRGPDVSIDVLLTWATTRFTSVTVRHEPRRDGRSKYTFGKLVAHALTMMTGASTAPLKLAGIVGLVLVACGATGLIGLGARAVTAREQIPELGFLAAVVVFLGGAQLLALGVLGEYVARLFARATSRPSYAVRTRTPRAAEEVG